MQSHLAWEDGPSPPDGPPPSQHTAVQRGEVLPAAVEAAIWRGDQLGGPIGDTVSTGFEALDAALPGGGWPCQGLTEVLTAQYSLLEWRLLAPALRAISDARKPIVVVGAPHPPFPAGLRREGIDESNLIWIDVDTPAQRLWATEQLIKSSACGIVLSWLPAVRREQIHRMQVLAATCEAPAVLFRLADAAEEASAAPLRLIGAVDIDWALNIKLLKRKGPPLDRVLRLPSVPGGIQDVMTPRLRYPSRLVSREPEHVVVRPASAISRQHAAS
jgi:protein ImuA